MRKLDKSRIIGKIMFTSGIVGTIISLLFLIITWIAKVRINNFLLTTYSSMQSVLTISKDGLTLINESIRQAEDSLSMVETVLNDMASSINNLVPITNATAEIIGGDLNTIIMDAQTSLDSASSGSKLVDDTLKILAAIPLLGLDFQPDVPLHTSLSLLSSDLNNLPGNLSVIQSNLQLTGESIKSLASKISDLSSDLGVFKDNIENSEVIIADYELAIDNLENNLIRIQDKTNLWLTLISILVSLLMVWLLLAQITPLYLAHEILIGKNQYVNVHDIHKKEDTTNPTLNKGV